VSESLNGLPAVAFAATITAAVKIKLQGLLNGVTALREEFGDEATQRVIQSCSESVRERCENGIAIEWHDVAEFCEFLEQAERQLGTGDGHIAQLVGAAGATINTKSLIKRAAMFTLQPEFVLRRVSAAWDQFNDEGSLDVLEVTTNRCSIELSGVDGLDPLFCATLTGWARVMSERVGWTPATARHASCRGQGDERCVWIVTWPPRS